MRHRRKGRTLGRSPSHQRALLRNLASSLFLTQRDDDLYTDPNKPPPNKGRIVTTLAKAKEVRPLVEKCITIARRSLPDLEKADGLEPDAERNSDEWRTWRQGNGWQEWNAAVAPVLAARRRCIKLLGNPAAVEILFDDIAPRFADRNGGYTRVVRLAQPRLGDAGTRAILEFVGADDRRAAKAQAQPLDEVEGETAAPGDATESETPHSQAAEEQPAKTDEMRD